MPKMLYEAKIKKMVQAARECARARVVADAEREKAISEVKEQYPNTPYEKRRLSEIEEKYKRDIKAIESTYAPMFSSMIQEARAGYQSREMRAPSEGQLRALQLLNMRSNVSADELQEVANLCKGCYAAYGLIADIARKNGVRMTMPQTPYTSIGWMDQRMKAFTGNINGLLSDAKWAVQMASMDDRSLTGRLFGLWADEGTMDYSEAQIQAIYGADMVPSEVLNEEAPKVAVNQKKGAQSVEDAPIVWENNPIA